MVTAIRPGDEIARDDEQHGAQPRQGAMRNTDIMTLDQFFTNDDGVKCLGPEPATKPRERRSRPCPTMQRVLLDRSWDQSHQRRLFGDLARRKHRENLWRHQHEILHTGMRTQSGHTPSVDVQLDPDREQILTASGDGRVELHRLPGSGVIGKAVEDDLRIVNLCLPTHWSPARRIRTAWPLGLTRQSDLLAYNGGSPFLMNFDLEVCKEDRPTSVIGSSTLCVETAYFLPRSSDLVAYAGRKGPVEMSDFRVHSSPYYPTRPNASQYRKAIQSRIPICGNQRNVYSICPGDFEGRTVVVADEGGWVRLCDSRKISSSIGVASMGQPASSAQRRESTVVVCYKPQAFSQNRHDAVQALSLIPNSMSSVAYQTLEGSCGALDIVSGDQVCPPHSILGGISGQPDISLFQECDGEWAIFSTNGSTSVTILPLRQDTEPTEISTQLGRISSVCVGQRTRTVALGLSGIGPAILGHP